MYFWRKTIHIIHILVFSYYVIVSFRLISKLIYLFFSIILIKNLKLFYVVFFLSLQFISNNL